jgi:hypothetical protein
MHNVQSCILLTTITLMFSLNNLITLPVVKKLDFPWKSEAIALEFLLALEELPASASGSIAADVSLDDL